MADAPFFIVNVLLLMLYWLVERPIRFIFLSLILIFSCFVISVEHEKDLLFFHLIGTLLNVLALLLMKVVSKRSVSLELLRSVNEHRLAPDYESMIRKRELECRGSGLFFYSKNREGFYLNKFVSGVLSNALLVLVRRGK